MTPQLQQAIRLLQLSTLDLQQEIQDALDSNPLLEVEDTTPEPSNEQSIEDKIHKADNEINEANAKQDDGMAEVKEPEANEALQKETIREELPTDSEWDDYISAGPNTSSGPAPEEHQVYQGETTENIRDYLTWQMNLTPFSDTDLAIATTIVEAIDDKGFLTVDAEDILLSLGNDEVELDEVIAVLKRVQFFEPVGVAARNLKECLYIQLTRYDSDTPWLEEAKTIVSEHIDLLGARDYRTLMRKTKLKEDQLKQVMNLFIP